MSALAALTSEDVTEVDLRALLLNYRRENWRGIQSPEWHERVVEAMLREDGSSILEQTGSFVSLPRGARILDVGSGTGGFVVGCRRKGFNAFGVEPDRIGHGTGVSSIQIASRRVHDRVFACAMGESLPFADASFDLVTLNQVIEHVCDQTAVLGEALRVLKHGGAIYVACPNYLRFYEPHYKVFWLPLMPKWLGRWYVKARGRSPVLLDQITYTTNRRLYQLFSKVNVNVLVIDLHRDSFLKKCASGTFASAGARLVARAIRMPIIGRLILSFTLVFLKLTEGSCEMLLVKASTRQGVTC